jgi:hypothetical protein
MPTGFVSNDVLAKLERKDDLLEADLCPWVAESAVYVGKLA